MIVAPSGSTKSTLRRFTFALSTAVSIVTGSVAELLAVANAVRIGRPIWNKKRYGFRRVRTHKMSGSVTNACTASPVSTVAEYHPTCRISFRNSPSAAASPNCPATRQNTPSGAVHMTNRTNFISTSLASVTNRVSVPAAAPSWSAPRRRRG